MPAVTKHLEALSERLTESRFGVPLALKLRAAHLILRMRERRSKAFGLFVIVGWQNKWRKHLDVADAEQDIFARRHWDIMHDAPEKHRGHDVAATADFDGAILIDKRGVVLHSGAVIEGLRPSVVARKLRPGKFRDLSEQFGFSTKVHTRHLAAITASYVFSGTTVYTVSEENDAFHVFEKGRIVFEC